MKFIVIGQHIVKIKFIKDIYPLSRSDWNIESNKFDHSFLIKVDFNDKTSTTIYFDDFKMREDALTYVMEILTINKNKKDEKTSSI